MTDLVSIGFAADTRQLRTAETDLNRLTAAGGKLDGSMSELTKTIGVLGTAFAALGGAAIIGRAIAEAKAFETALIGVAKTTGLSGAELAAFSDQISGLSTSIPVTTAELLELAQAAGQMGVTGSANLEKFSITVAKLGRASDLAGSEAATALARILNVTGENIESIDVLASVIVSLGNNFAATESEIARMTTEVARATSVFGVTSSEAAGLGAAMASIGIQAELGGSSVGRAMQAITSAVMAGGAELDNFTRTIGVNSKALTDAFASDKVAALEIFLQAIRDQGLGAANALDELGLGGQEIAKTIIPLANNLGIFTRAQQLANEEVKNATALDREFEATLGTLDSQLIITNNILTQMAKELGQSLTPALAQGLKSFNEWASEGDNLSALMASIANGAAAAAVVFTTSMIPALYKSAAGFVLATAESVRYQIALARMAGVSAAAAVATTALGNAVKVALGPIGLVIAIIGTAALTFNSYAAETDLAKRSSAELKTEIEQLTGSMEKLTKAQAELLQVRIAERMEQIETSLSQMSLAAGASSEELQAIFGDRFKNAVVESAAAAETLNEEMKRLKSQSAELSVIINGGSAPAVERLTKKQKEAIKAADKLRESFADQVVSLELQRQQLILSSDEFEILKAKMEALAYGATPAMVAGIEAAAKSFQKFRKASEGLDTLMEGGLFSFPDTPDSNLDKLIDKVKDFGGAWSQAGSEIINAFGGVSAVIGDYANRMEDLIDLQSKLTIEKSKYAEGSAEAAKADLALAEIQQDMFASNIGAVSRLAGVTAKAFKEQSKERQALHRLETAFAAIEIALAAEKAVANAVAAVANQGSGDPYTAFGRIAAMIGIMAGVLGVAGIAFSGGGGGGAPATNSGSGTVLGSDDPSASVSNSAAAFEEIALDQLAELRGIRDAMNGLNSGIAQLATSLLTGGQLGGAGVTGLGTTQNASGIVNLADKLGLSSILGALGDNIVGAVLGGIFGSTKSKLIDTGIKFDTQELGDIIAGGFEGYYYSVIETTKKKLFGLSKKVSTRTETTALEDVILEQIGGIFVYLADAVSGAVDVLGVDMVKTIESFNISLGSISFEGLSGEEIQQKLEDVISQQGDLLAVYVLPQIKEYQKIGEGALETLLRVSKEQVVFNDALDMIGQSLGDMSNLMRIDVAQSIITMMGGLEEFSDSVNLYFKEFFTESEQLDFLTKSLTEAMAGLGFELPMTREGFRALVDSLDLTTEAGQKAFAALMELVPGMAEYFDQIEKQTEALTDYEGAAKAALDMLQKSIQVEKDRAQAVYAAAQAAYAAEVERINGVKRAIEQQYETLQNNAANAETALVNSFNAEKAAIQSRLEIEKAAIQSAADLRIESLSAEASMARQVASDLRRVQEQFAANTVTVEQALKAARRGDFSLAQQLSPSDIEASAFGSAEEFRAAQAVQAGRLNEIGQLAGSRASAAERAADAAERQITAIQDTTAEQIAALDKAAEEQMAALDRQLNALLGIDTTVLPLAEAIQKYQDAQLALDEFNYEGQISRLDEQLVYAEEMLSLAEKAYQDEIARLDAILLDSQEQLNALLGIDTSIMSLTDAVNNFNSSIAALAESMKPQTVSPAAAQQTQTETELREELKQEREMNAAALRAIAKSSERTSGILQRMEMNQEVLVSA